MYVVCVLLSGWASAYVSGIYMSRCKRALTYTCMGIASIAGISVSSYVFLLIGAYV